MVIKDGNRTGTDRGRTGDRPVTRVERGGTGGEVEWFERAAVSAKG